jgi:three-Cys-motif partner protein
MDLVQRPEAAWPATPRVARDGSIADHEFGGVSTDLKLSLVESYLKAFMTALRGSFRELWYIDAFAGTGERTERIAAQGKDLLGEGYEASLARHRGSARIAIEVEPAFDRLIFIDKDARHCEALRDLSNASRGRRIDVLHGDANDRILELTRRTSWFGRRAVMFLDPYGMSVSWQTLEAIRATEAIDVWYLVSLSGIFRQSARRGEAIDDAKRAALTRMLGTDAWEQAWYRRYAQVNLFGGTDEYLARIADVDAMQAFVTERLRSLFPAVLKPLRLRDRNGVPQFALFFAISNPDPKAIGLATRIANTKMIRSTPVAEARAAHRRRR